MTTETTLKRSLTLPLITFYGLGTIIGAGIYVLIGAVAGKAGMFAPISFLLAACVAALTALSYAELSSRLPYSAGEAAYMQEAFGRAWLSLIAGLSVACIGIVSAATIANGFVGYLAIFTQQPDWLVITALVIGLGLIAAWGITESVWIASSITLLEIGGLIFVILIAGDSLAQLPERWPELIPPWQDVAWGGILLGATLAFYAFIGFEDMVNVAEEVKDARHTLPRSIILALLIATVLYLTVALVAVLALPIDELAASTAPLATIVAAHGEDYTLMVSGISLIAVVNGALIQIIMVSRVLYGMASRQLLHPALSRVHPRTRTPLTATALTTLAILALALWLPLTTLALITSFITLIVFAGVNLSLLRIKRQRKPPGSVEYSAAIPFAGLLLCLALLTFMLISQLS